MKLHSLIIIIVAFSLSLLISQFANAAIKIVPGEFFLERVIDGDTIKMMNKETSIQVRFLGIDTPELGKSVNDSQCLANDAKFFVENILARGKKIILTSDPENRDRDDQGRLLRYVDVVENDGTVLRLNEMLVRWGLARVAWEYPISEKMKYLLMEKISRENKIGIWGKCNIEKNLQIFGLPIQS